MTLQQFITKYQGKPVDFDKNQSYQCVDLMRQYIVDVLGLPGYCLPALGNSGGAKTLYQNFRQTDLFTKIDNTPNNMPQPGDIVFWGFYPLVTGWAGHVAIATQAGLYKFVSFDQNYPTGSLCHLQSHSYKGVLGWLRRK